MDPERALRIISKLWLPSQTQQPKRAGENCTITCHPLVMIVVRTFHFENTTVSGAAAALPELKGYGIVKDLRVAMTGDPTLLAMVTAVKNLPSSTNWAAHVR
jgi:hypothetical protein